MEKFLKNNDYTNESEINLYNKVVLSSILPTFAAFFISMFILMMAFYDTPSEVFAGALLYFILAIISWILAGKACKRINQHTQKGVDEINKWEALKKFMEDFSTMDKKDLPSIVLWDKYLVYATAFGMADKVIKQLKVVYPEMANDTNFNTYSNWIF